MEPNDDMRRAAEARLSREPGFRSLPGRAEATGLEDDSIDLVVAGQAFHWFEADPTRTEFRRILRADGRVALFWNSRRTDTAFNGEYEGLIERFALDRRYTCCRAGEEDAVESLFVEPPIFLRFPNAQQFDLQGLRGRMESSSYTPSPEHPSYLEMLQALETLFEKHERDGLVTFEYHTELYIGRV